MPKTKYKTRPGVTLVELLIAATTTIIVLAGVAALLADSHRGWNTVYNRAYGDVITDSYTATVRFNAIMRQATVEGLSIDPSGEWVEVQCYADENSTIFDRYTRLSESNGDLNIEYGLLDPRGVLSSETVCANVSACTFTQVGQSVHMTLTLDDGTQSNETVSCGYLHN